MKFVLAIFMSLAFSLVHAEQLSAEQAYAVSMAKHSNVNHEGKMFKLKDGSEISFDELQVLLETGFDVTQILASTAAGQPSGNNAGNAISGNPSPIFNATPSSTFTGGGGGAASRS